MHRSPNRGTDPAADHVRSVHRPDHGRSYESLLWTFAELPVFFRNRKHGFFKFAHVLSSTVEDIEGGMPALLKKFVLTFFDPSGWSFATTGLEIPVPGQPNENVRATFVFSSLMSGRSNSAWTSRAMRAPSALALNALIMRAVRRLTHLRAITSSDILSRVALGGTHTRENRLSKFLLNRRTSRTLW